MDFDHPPEDPVALLLEWIEDARRAGLPNPNAMTLATADAHGRPSARIVLLKALEPPRAGAAGEPALGGAVFYTNRLSRKGQELAANPRAMLLFFWDVLNRQVRIEGKVSHTSDAESDAYFATRPRGSQIGAWASKQSQPASSRAELEQAVAEVQQRYEGVPVPRPPHWGGYRVSLDSIEFWQGHEFRLHDRVVYTPVPGQPGKWHTQRLYP